MNYKQTLTLLYDLPVHIPVLLIGNHGIGKSALVKELGRKENIPVIDIRLSQCEPGDLKGMPIAVNGVTTFLPPDFFPLDDESKREIESRLGVQLPSTPDRGILFFDELNRASRDVAQAVFELVYDRTLSTRKIKEGWRIIAAINGDDELYTVNTMDPALLSRFCVVQFNPSVDEWLDWARENNIHPLIINFIANHPELLDPTPEQIQESSAKNIKIHDRRNWDYLSQVLSKMDKLESDRLSSIGHCFIGSTVIRLVDYFIKEYKILTPSQILEMDPVCNDILDKASVPEYTQYAKALIQYISDNLSELTERQSKAITEFVRRAPLSVRGAFWTEALNKIKRQISKWYATDGKELILESFVVDKPQNKKQKKEGKSSD